ncbi:hypothetical protein Tsp_06825, partial [Trichinella spiralis]|jgi:hypothetical protein
MSDV